MGFLYPRTIKITRPAVTGGVGVLGYQGEEAASETVIVTNVPASIQLKRPGKAPGTNLPGDTDGRGDWQILFKQPLGTVLERDIITDDLGVRYQVTNCYWNSLGYAVRAERLLT